MPIDKGQAVRDLVTRSGARTALYGGDDATDLDAFSELEALIGEDVLDAAVRVGVSSTRARARSSSAPTWSWTEWRGSRGS